MEKTITIDGRSVAFKSNGATPLLYKAQFGVDFFKEILKLAPLQEVKTKKNKLDSEQIDALDFEVFYNLCWVMAKSADPTIPGPIDWLAEFDEFPMLEIIDDLQGLIVSTLSSKKKKSKQPGKRKTNND